MDKDQVRGYKVEEEEEENYEDDNFDENSIKKSQVSDNTMPALPDIGKMFNIDLKLFGDTLQQFQDKITNQGKKLQKVSEKVGEIEVAASK